jgi:hypothetical protein
MSCRFRPYVNYDETIWTDPGNEKYLKITN